MTGHGEAHVRENGVSVAVEVRTINSRYFKLSVRAGEGYGSLETPIENIVRKHVRRGTIQVNVRIDREASADDYKLNTAVLAGYRSQLESLKTELHLLDALPLESLLALPGVVDERAAKNLDAESDWPLIERTLTAALENLARMRSEEGRAMTADLTANCEVISRELAAIEILAPKTVEAYRKRLGERLTALLTPYDVTIGAADIVREVGIFAERADISEEIVRLKSHLGQFDTYVDDADGGGRKLDFLIQEMFREANTIGSKANDSDIARHVIEIKAAIEKMREMIQNVE
jgi:uncharacterized protein (TIGR00255 family)